LKLYSQIFENEPAALVGVDRTMRLVLSNKSAMKLFGDGLADKTLQPLKDTPVAQFAPAVLAAVEKAVQGGDPSEMEARNGSDAFVVSVFGLRSGSEIRGAMIRISRGASGGI
jgi:hypothetical protein